MIISLFVASCKLSLACLFLLLAAFAWVHDVLTRYRIPVL